MPSSPPALVQKSPLRVFLTSYRLNSIAGVKPFQKGLCFAGKKHLEPQKSSGSARRCLLCRRMGLHNSPTGRNSSETLCLCVITNLQAKRGGDYNMHKCLISWSFLTHKVVVFRNRAKVMLCSQAGTSPLLELFPLGGGCGQSSAAI